MSLGTPKRGVRFVLATMACAALAPGGAHAKAYLSQEAALKLAFGEGASVSRQSVFMTEGQLRRARELVGAGIEIPSPLVVRYEGSRGGASLGFAYFDTHVVRTLPESVMIVIAPGGSVSRVEILSFAEPEEYLPRARWLAQFPGRALDRELSLKRGVHGITGATLSAQAVTDAARRMLAIDRALAGGGGAPE